MLQVFCHLIGDYFLQSTWMAQNKVVRWWPAIVHVGVYSIPFILVFHPSALALLLITVSHAFIDRYRLAKYVCYTSHFLAPASAWKPWKECRVTGYHETVPVWLATTLMIVVDNSMHLAINYYALTYL